MSKDTNKQTAATLFASTTHDVLWANPKGEFFTSENIGTLSLKAGQKLTKFERTEEVTEDDKAVKPMTATDAIAFILKAESLEELKPFETDERKTVKIAYDGRTAELVAKIEVSTSQEVKTAEGTQEGTNGNEDTEDKK
ncbi:hypothetical protein [Flavobacterium frigoris]|uniref:Uncharacterized protein n=1 Tax=Flavobacterium frigoris TaxID=229204 RepID=A0A1H9LM97_FLAFI|nr:hypothetical protein [Flavobacterium frigoris]SER12013.1 hypothetical protein SAMN05444355_10764 [Flavobacterium frigoris]